MEYVMDIPGEANYYTYRCKNNGKNCEKIDSFNLEYPNANLMDLSLDKNGNGFAIAYNGKFEKFVNGKKVSSIWYSENPLESRLSYTGNNLYVFNEVAKSISATSYITKCDKNAINCYWFRLYNINPIDSSFR
jgi:hypothetical protein